MKIKKNSIIFVAGHKGMVGSSIIRALKEKNIKKILTIDKKRLNLLNQKKVEKFLLLKKPDFVFVAAARVGGIYANSKNKYNFLYENLQIQNNIINGSYRAGIKNLIFLGSACIYPKKSKQPIKENSLLSGKLEPSNDAYAIAKIAGLKLCDYLHKNKGLNFKTLMPNNVYGINDNYHKMNSHFFPALIRKTVDAIYKKRNFIEIWGSGKPKRELVFVDDLADACIYFIQKKTKESIINIGSGIEMSINDYQKKIMKYLNVSKKIKHNLKMPNGMMRKKLNLMISKKYGWKAKYTLKKGFELTLKDYLAKKKINLKTLQKINI